MAGAPGTRALDFRTQPAAATSRGIRGDDGRRAKCPGGGHLAAHHRPMTRAATFLLALALFPASTSRADAQAAASEYEVKAAYLYNFGRFVTWPPDSSDGEAFSICVLGRDPFGRVLDTTLA